MSYEPTNTYYGINYFNPSDWLVNSAYATVAMLRNYGNLNMPNIWTQTNMFFEIICDTINGVPKTVFDYLVNIKQDVQTELNKLIAIAYDSNTKTTYVNDNLYATYMGSSNDIETQTMNSTNVNCQVLNSTSLQSTSITTTTIKTNTISFNNDVGLYLFSGAIFFPMMKSQSNLSFPSNTTVNAHLKNGYSIVCKNVKNELLVSLSNNSNDFYYNVSIPSSVTSIELYLNNRKLT